MNEWMIMAPQKGVYNRHHSQKQLVICQEKPTWTKVLLQSTMLHKRA